MRVVLPLDNEVKLLIAVGQDCTVHAVTSWLPVRRGGKLVGYTLDFMRRRPNAFNGALDLLIATAIRDCQRQELEFMSRSGAPLARLAHGDRAKGMQRALDLFGRVLQPIYGFRSLVRLQGKIPFRVQATLPCLSRSLALPRIGHATRAYLPHLTGSQVLHLLRKLVSGRRAPGAARPTGSRGGDDDRRHESGQSVSEPSTYDIESSIAAPGARVTKIASP